MTVHSAPGTQAEIDIDAAIEAMGGAQKIHDDAVRFSASVDQFLAQQEDLWAKHEGKWVAFFDGKLVAIAADFESVLSCARSAGAHIPETLVQKLAPYPRRNYR